MPRVTRQGLSCLVLRKPLNRSINLTQKFRTPWKSDNNILLPHECRSEWANEQTRERCERMSEWPFINVLISRCTESLCLRLNEWATSDKIWPKICKNGLFIDYQWLEEGKNPCIRTIFRFERISVATWVEHRDEDVAFNTYSIRIIRIYHVYFEHKTRYCCFCDVFRFFTLYRNRVFSQWWKLSAIPWPVTPDNPWLLETNDKPTENNSIYHSWPRSVLWGLLVIFNGRWSCNQQPHLMLLWSTGCSCDLAFWMSRETLDVKKKNERIKDNV